MRILVVTNNYTPYSSGVVNSINAITQELFVQGHNVKIVTLSFLDNHCDDPDYVVRIYCPFKFMYKKNYMAISWMATSALYKIMREYNPDIVHVHHPFLLGISARNVASKLGLTVIFTYHSLYEEFAHYIPFCEFITKPVIQSLVSRFSKTVHGIIVPSSLIKQKLLNDHVLCPVAVIPSPIRQLFFETPLSHIDDMHIKRKDIFTLLLVSRFSQEKNIPFLFKLLKKLPQGVRLILVGYGPEAEYLKALAYGTYLFSDERVIFIEKPSLPKLIELYRLADLFVFPSSADTQGLVLAEAMSQGIPVIAVEGPGQTDIIKQGKNGFIINSVDQAVVIISLLMNNDDAYRQLSHDAYQTARDYQGSRIVHRLLQFYQQINF